MGAQKVKGKFIAANFGQGGADLKFADVTVANAELKTLRATPKVLVPAPGAGMDAGVPVCDPASGRGAQMF